MREMKDSGIEWIGEIPKDWKVKRLKYLYDYTDGSPVRVGPFGSELNSKEFQSEGIWVYNQRTVLDENFISNDVFITEEKAKKLSAFTVKTNDILITTRGTIGKIAIVPKYAEQGIIHPCIIRFRINSKLILSRYVKYIFNDTDITMNQIFYKSNGSTIEVLYSYNLRDILLPLPSIAQQINITDFLDTQCSEIDATAEDIQKEISLLEDYKKSVITEAVTKGLNPDAEMKDSGIEWIGEIPKDWDTHPVYAYFEEGKTKNYRMQEQNLLSLSYGRIIRKDINTNGGLLPASFNIYNVVEAGDIIIRPTDLQNDKRSLRTGFVKEQGIITSAYIDLRPKKDVNSEYYHYLLHSYDIIKVFYNMGNGVRQGLNYSEFAKLLLLEPSQAEQQQIVDYLNAQCSEIDTLIADKKRQLDILADYKKSLIYEYVTGKKEVPVNE